MQSEKSRALYEEDWSKCIGKPRIFEVVSIPFAWHSVHVRFYDAVPRGKHTVEILIESRTRSKPYPTTKKLAFSML